MRNEGPKRHGAERGASQAPWRSRGIPALPLLLALAAAAGCSEFLRERAAIRTAEYSLKSVHLDSLGWSGANFDVVLGVRNPNDVAAVLDAVSFDFYLEDDRLAKGSTDAQLRIAPEESARLPIDVHVEYDEIAGVVGLLRSREPKDYRIEGTSRIETPLGDLTFPFEVEGRFR